jgi:hypothetical protein
VNIRTFQTRLIALPMRHKVVAGLLAASLSIGFRTWILRQPAEYSSSAVLSFTAPPQVDLASQPTSAGAVASAVFRDRIRTGHLVLTAPGGAQSGYVTSAKPFPWTSSELRIGDPIISEISASKVRVSWIGRDPQETQNTTRVLANTLAAWEPLAKQLSPPREMMSAAEDPGRKREESLLRVTISVLDLKETEVRAELDQIETAEPQGRDQNQQKRGRTQTQVNLANLSVRNRLSLRYHDRGRILTAELRRLQNQRTIVVQRLAEIQHSNSQNKAAVDPAAVVASDSASWASHTHPFLIVQETTTAQPVDTSRPQREALGDLSGVTVGLLYLVVELRRFRPIRNIADLNRVLAGNVPIMGAIAKIKETAG